MSNSNDGSGAAAIRSPQANAAGKVIANFALQHFKAATLAWRHVVRLEGERPDNTLGPFFEEIQAYGSVCVLSSVATLESLINELFLAEDSPLRAALVPSFEAEFWGKLERKFVLTKYKKALELMNLPGFNENAHPYVTTELLVQLRNALVHFKPDWDQGEPGWQPRDFENELAPRFAQSRFVGPTEDFVTMRAMSGAGATWAIETARAFMLDFKQRTGLYPKKFDRIIRRSLDT